VYVYIHFGIGDGVPKLVSPHGSYVNCLPVLIKFEHIVQIFVRNERLFCFPQITNVLTLFCKILGDIVQNDERLTLCETRTTVQRFITKVRDVSYTTVFVENDHLCPSRSLAMNVPFMDCSVDNSIMKLTLVSSMTSLIMAVRKKQVPVSKACKLFLRLHVKIFRLLTKCQNNSQVAITGSLILGPAM